MKPQIGTLLTASLLLGTFNTAQAGVLPEAADSVKIALAKKPTTRPMTVAYVPDYKRYYVADGGLGAVEDGINIPLSKSEVHIFNEQGEYLQSERPGLDNRSIYFNRNHHRLESVTYNISSWAGFSPNSGIFTLELDDKGTLTRERNEVSGYNPAFGDDATMPSYDPETDRYFAKQKRSNKVWIVKLNSREKAGEITLDLSAAGVKFDDISDSYVAWTGVAGENLAVLDVDHKCILVFNEEGKFVGRSQLPAGIKLRAQNHYNGLGYANDLFFVYNESEGEFGTYHGFRIFDKAVNQAANQVVK